MVSAITGRNWQLIIAGVLLVLFGVVALVFPGLTLASMAFMVGAAFLFSGIVNIVTYLRDRDSLDLSGYVLAYGIVDVLVGLMFLVHPVVFSVVLPWVAGLFVIVFAIYEIIGSFAVRRGGFSLWGWILVSGIASLLIGVSFYIWPEMLALYVGLFALLRGASLVILGANAERFV